MKRQKRAVLINDVTGFSRCSIAAMLPILSAMKIQTSFIPTAILSVNTEFKKYYIDDYTEKMIPYIDTYKELQLEFDAICSGFLGSMQQIDILIDFIKHFKQANTFVLIDPVMGDHGHLYGGYTKEMCNKMKELIQHADIITPNLTELSLLLNKDYPNVIPSFKELEIMCKELSKQGPKKIVITGLLKDNQITNYIFEEGKTSQTITIPKIGIDRSGTGDVFSAIIIGNYINGKNFYECVNEAVNFVSKCIKYTDSLQLPFNHGLCFEEYLTSL